MDSKWDLWILDPTFILLGLIAIGVMLYKERLSWKWLLFFGETILYWFANGVLAKWNANLMNVPGHFSSPIMITLILFGTGAFMAIILKPLATWSTGRAHHRRWWMYGSIAATFLALALTFVNTGFVEVQWLQVVVLVATGFLLGMSIAANSLYFLFANEQFYYRVAPALTGALMSVTTLFGTFVGGYAMQIETMTHSANLISNVDIYGISRLTYNDLIVFVVAMGLLVISTFLILANRENPQTVRGFDSPILKQLPQYNKKVIWYMVISVVSISAFYALTQSSLVTDFIETKLLLQGKDIEVVKLWTRVFGSFYAIPQILFGYLIYKTITKNIGYKATMTGMIGVSIVAAVILVFTSNPYAFIFLNLVMGLAINQVFFAYFSMAIMWNYRSHGFPVTGFASASNSLGAFFVETIIDSLKTYKVGIYNGYDKIDALARPENHKALEAFNQSADTVTTIMFAGIIVLLVAAEIWIFFTSDVVFADYVNIKDANLNMRKLLKMDTTHKIETRVSPNALEIGSRNDWNK